MGPSPSRPVRRFSGLTILLTILAAAAILSSVAIVNRYPLMHFDSRVYWKSGKVATEMATAIVGRVLHGAPQTAPATPDATGAAADSSGAAQANDLSSALKSAKGVRSPFYSLYLYLTWLTASFWGSIYLQGMATAYILWLFARSVWPALTPVRFLAGIAILTLTSSVAWFSSEIMPDLFAGIVIVGTAILAFYAASLSTVELVAMILLQAFAISTHTSHLGLALALSLLTIVQSLWSRAGLAATARLAARTGTPIVLAVVAALGASYVGFHEISIAPQHPPFLLGRVIEDGPARWFLKADCPDPRFVMCEFVDHLPVNNDGFLWDDDGIFTQASPAVRDRIRKEEMPLVLAAVRAYPFEQLQASISNALGELVRFSNTDFHLTGRPSIVDGQFVYRETDFTPVPVFIYDVELAAVVASIAALLGAFFVGDKVVPSARRLVVLVAVGILVNAVICGAFAALWPRYQSRVMWVLPAVALSLGTGLLHEMARRRSTGADRRPADVDASTRTTGRLAN
jgi:hypothetical protein